jgi:hypothetical protein
VTGECSAIATTRADDDFRFLCGGKTYGCPSDIAHLLCPKLRDLTATDSTIGELSLEAADPNSGFDDFLALGRSGMASFAENDRPFLLCLAKELKNYQLYSQILSTITDSPTLLTSVSTIAFREEDCHVELEFIATHFDEMMAGLFAELSFEVAFSVLSSPSLSIGSEDGLCAM